MVKRSGLEASLGFAKNVALRRALDAPSVERIVIALLRHNVLVFRDTDTVRLLLRELVLELQFPEDSDLVDVDTNDFPEAVDSARENVHGDGMGRQCLLCRHNSPVL